MPRPRSRSGSGAPVLHPWMWTRVDRQAIEDREGDSVTDDLIPFDFHGDELLLMDVDGRPSIVLKPALEGIGVDYWAQVERLRRRSWAVTRKARVTAADGKSYEMLTTDVRTFGMLLATIDENRVAKDVRPKLVAYQAEVADAIEAYWTKGGAINARASADQLAALRAQAEVLTALSGIVDAGWLDAKGRILAARALGETPELDQSTKPLTVSIYLAGRGVKGKQADSIGPMFGKRLKALYVATFGVEPPSIEDVVKRHTVQVAQYQEQHRHLFDQVWANHFDGVAS